MSVVCRPLLGVVYLYNETQTIDFTGIVVIIWPAVSGTEFGECVHHIYMMQRDLYQIDVNVETLVVNRLRSEIQKELDLIEVKHGRTYMYQWKWSYKFCKLLFKANMCDYCVSDIVYVNMDWYRCSPAIARQLNAIKYMLELGCTIYGGHNYTRYKIVLCFHCI